LHELHQRGYQQLRLHPGWSPNGACVRWNIYPKCVIEDTGSFERDNYEESPSGYHGSAGCPTNDLNPQEMADHFLTVAPKLCADAKHPDEEYVQWFSILVDHAKKGEYPTAYGEFFPKGKGWIIQPGEQYIPYPPFVNVEKIPLIEAWDKFSFTGRSWSYYLDKCIYFKGEEECPPAVLKTRKEQAWKEERWWVSDHFPYKFENNKSCDDFFKKIIKEYKDLGLSHFRKHDGVCISLKAFLYKRRAFHPKSGGKMFRFPVRRAHNDILLRLQGAVDVVGVVFQLLVRRLSLFPYGAVGFPTKPDLPNEVIVLRPLFRIVSPSLYQPLGIVDEGIRPFLLEYLAILLIGEMRQAERLDMVSVTSASMSERRFIWYSFLRLFHKSRHYNRIIKISDNILQ
jgi:hypothetical protein